ncbi:hypothetical protein BpHYR1_024958 [Brachionus plicatilis]|uniref:Uncharacterized protein n=1 Tax=Brachionus plicatilis TaxID=10195 RepID=A0A3M7P7L4_BRAPC|nr:hypothetical protein BpHYR1_024958 [Brachionus plicatilis]
MSLNPKDNKSRNSRQLHNANTLGRQLKSYLTNFKSAGKNCIQELNCFVVQTFSFYLIVKFDTIAKEKQSKYLIIGFCRGRVRGDQWVIVFKLLKLIFAFAGPCKTDNLADIRKSINRLCKMKNFVTILLHIKSVFCKNDLANEKIPQKINCNCKLHSHIRQPKCFLLGIFWDSVLLSSVYCEILFSKS